MQKFQISNKVSVKSEQLEINTWNFLLLFFSQYGEQLLKVWSIFSDTP